jgi:hypothetical protein
LMILHYQQGQSKLPRYTFQTIDMDNDIQYCNSNNILDEVTDYLLIITLFYNTFAIEQIIFVLCFDLPNISL